MTADLFGLATALARVDICLGFRLLDLWQRTETAESALDTPTEGDWRAYFLWDEIFRNPES